ncbi:DUF1905 domain-containing protein [Kribbella sp. NPDC051770]|uniref:DUF1905 domain-containing protein n=1 Tax=Kribbella sp. NPDC051770 TaxID=3155413 RepID=UPI0034183318
MDVTFTGEIFYWRGPSPFHFVAVPEDESTDIEATSTTVSYGWGMIPVTARIGDTEWTTALFPKDGKYLLPVKDAIRKAESIEEGTTVTAHLHIAL